MLSQDQINQYNTLFNQISNNPSAQGALSMTAGGSQQGMSSFMNTPAYALAYGNNTAANPAQRFAQDYGTQMSVYNGQQALSNQFAGQGLGSSGALAQGLSQNMYNNYGNYITGQESMFGNYQNQLANLAQFGSTQTGATQAVSAGNTLAGLQSAAGNAIGSADLNTGSNISQLLANEGSFLAGSTLNTGAAEANNVYNGNVLSEGILANMMNANASTASSALSGQGASLGSSALANQSSSLGNNYAQSYLNSLNTYSAANGYQY
jgi:hypothetical protein